MRNSQQYPIGTIFRRSWDGGNTYQEFEVLEYDTTRSGIKARMTYEGAFAVIDYYSPESILSFGFEVVLPKSDNFTTLYDKLNENR